MSLTYFVLDSHLATLWESNCPFGFPLVLFPLGSRYFVFVFLSFHVSDGRCGIIVSIADHCLPFYCSWCKVWKENSGNLGISVPFPTQ